MSVIKRVSLLILITWNLFAGPAFSQCCSTGSPVGASVYIGVLEKNTLRFIAFYRRNYSDAYYEGDSKVTENNQLKSSNYNFAGITLGYGITKRLTLETDFGYFFNKTQVFNNIDFKEEGYGLSNAGVTLKYGALILPAKHIELTFGAGFRYPFTKTPQEKDGVQLSRDVQPTTNGFGVCGLLFFNKGFPAFSMRLFTLNRFDRNFEDPLHYKYGDVLLNSVFVSKLIVKNFFAILQVRSEYRWKDADHSETLENTGNWVLFACPQLTYAIMGKWNVSVLVDIPFY